jgi:hypothetical protein
MAEVFAGTVQDPVCSGFKQKVIVAETRPCH